MNRRCPNCGFDNHAPGVSFCRNCGGCLDMSLARTSPANAAGQQAGPPAVTAQGPQIITPWPGMGVTWDPPPALEGTITSVQGPNRVRRSMLGEAILSVFLSWLKAPFAWLPMTRDQTEEVWTLCVADYQTGKQHDVTLIGTPIPGLVIGDEVALWGKESRGVLVMQGGYKYATDSHIRIRR